jgi:hypothetical protein
MFIGRLLRINGACEPHVRKRLNRLVGPLRRLSRFRLAHVASMTNINATPGPFVT